MQWLYAHGGDPYARLLRAEDEDLDAIAVRIREFGPLHRSRTGAWFTGDHALGRAILSDRRLSFRAPHGLPEGHVLKQCDALPSLAVAEQGQLSGRAELNPGMDAVERSCARVASGLGDTFDLVVDLVRPAMVMLAAEQLSVPAGQLARFGQSCAAVGTALDAVLCPPTLAHARGLIEAAGQLRALFSDHSGNDHDLVALGMLVSVIGAEVSANVATNTMLALLDRPEEWRALTASPESAAAAVERTLWHDPPIRLDCRVAREDLALAGQSITAGSEIVVHIESANRGARPGVDRFDPATDGPAVTNHLSLSGGPHLDLIAPLVRTAATGLVRTLAIRLPHLRRTASAVRRLRAPVTRAIVRFPVSA